VGEDWARVMTTKRPLPCPLPRGEEKIMTRNKE
jgi:hypothetical protein